jgi:DNA ligase-associated metallophosphoesterase
MVPLSFAGHELVMLPEAAIYWPARRALLLADLHFEKASWYARHGQMLPPYDSLATLEAIAALAARLEPREIWCLGDSFHDAAGVERLPGQARGRLETLARAARWTWITGNHDCSASIGIGAIAHEAELDGLLLRHEADPADTRPELSGHFHPKLRLSLQGRSLSRRCFVLSARKIILPAFGALTGGMDVRRPEIRRALGGSGEALVAMPDRLLRFPLLNAFTEW